jgi:hypothetical protein
VLEASLVWEVLSAGSSEASVVFSEEALLVLEEASAVDPPVALAAVPVAAASIRDVVSGRQAGNYYTPIYICVFVIVA